MTKFIYRARSYFVLMIYSYRINLRHTLHIILHKKYFAKKAKLRRKKIKKQYPKATTYLSNTMGNLTYGRNVRRVE